MKIVNGYVCQSGCEVDLAKKGIDPKNPHNDPVKARELEEQKALAAGRLEDTRAGEGPETAFGVEAVRFGGTLEGVTQRRAGDETQVARVLELVV